MGKKSIICPTCRKLISSDELNCPYCGLSRPGSWWNIRNPGNYLRDPSDVIRLLIYTNIALYILSIFLNPSSTGMSANPLTFLSPSDESLFLLGATGTIPIGIFHRWWTLISASFLHGSILHIFFNMVALRQLGPFVVSEYGVNRFFIIYIMSGIAGFLLSYFAGIRFTIGASASLTGLIGAIMYYGRSRGGFYGQMIYKQATGWVIGLALFGLLVPGINNWAHGGGIAAGFLLGYILSYQERRQESRAQRILAAGLVLVTAGTLLTAVIGALVVRIP
ncbi:MAG: rhomboid family intramembrane serine protease [Syntrophales bacterium]